MENQTLNKVEIRGRIGQEPRVNKVGETSVARFSVATNEIYKERSGDIKEETTWHAITAWEGKNIMDFDQLKKGQFVSITGRLRTVKYAGTDGADHQYMEVLASKLLPFEPEEEKN